VRIDSSRTRTSINEVTGAEKGEKWSVGPLKEIKVKRKRLWFFAWGGVFSLDSPFNGRPQAYPVESIAKRWKQDGSKINEGRKKLLILPDAGGSNGYRPRAWKYELQRKLCDPFGLCVTVCHYPPGASKWNPIEHRLFNAISNNWKGVPLNSYETIIKYLRKTETTPKKGPGLKVKATLVRKRYKKGQKVSDKEMSQLQLENHDTMPNWNYTISPTKM